MSEHEIWPARPKYGQMAVHTHKIASVIAPKASQNCAANSGSAELAADVEEFLPALVTDGGGIHPPHLLESPGDGVAGGRDHGGGVAMGAADRLFEGGIDHPRAPPVLGGESHI